MKTADWFSDAAEMALDWLADPRMFARGEYPRSDSLPVGAMRKEAS